MPRSFGTVGLFAGFSLIGAALCALIFLPHLTPANLLAGDHRKQSWLERISLSSGLDNSRLVWFILLVTPVFFYFASKVSFNSDVGKLNFMTEETIKAQKRLESINRSSLSAIYVVSSGEDLHAALRRTEQITPRLAGSQAARSSAEIFDSVDFPDFRFIAATET